MKTNCHSEVIYYDSLQNHYLYADYAITEVNRQKARVQTFNFIYLFFVNHIALHNIENEKQILTNLLAPLFYNGKNKPSNSKFGFLCYFHESYENLLKKQISGHDLLMSQIRPYSTIENKNSGKDFRLEWGQFKQYKKDINNFYELELLVENTNPTNRLIRFNHCYVCGENILSREEFNFLRTISYINKEKSLVTGLETLGFEVRIIETEAKI